MRRATLLITATFLLFSVCVAQNFDDTVASPEDRTWIPDYDLKTAAVFVMSNKAINGVFAFARERNGGLSQVGYFLTGGAGSDTNQASETPASATIQRPLAIVPGRRLLLATNAGSDSITVFRIESRTLTRLQTINTDGRRPVSLAVFENVVFVVNASGTPGIAGFKIGENDELTPIRDSARSLAGGPGSEPVSIDFNDRGTTLTVAERKAGVLETFMIDINGRPSDTSSSVVNGSNPAGLAFASTGHFIAAETFGGRIGSGAVSSYAVTGNGLKVVSASVSNKESGTCCVASSPNARSVYALNSQAGSISKYELSSDGTLVLTDQVLVRFDKGMVGLEMAPVAGRFLYVLTENPSSVTAFRMEYNGGLRPLGSFGLLPNGVRGITGY